MTATPICDAMKAGGSWNEAWDEETNQRGLSAPNPRGE